MAEKGKRRGICKLEKHETEDEIEERSIPNEGSHGLRFGTFAGNGIAGATIIDFVRFDEAQRHKSATHKTAVAKNIAFFAK